MSAPGNWQSSSFAETDPARIDRTPIEVLFDLALTHPEKTAVIHGARRFSFSELARRVGGLAQQILAADGPPGPVALIQSCGVAAVAGWFACSLAGRPLLLLEPQNPPERNRLLMTLAGATLLIHDDAARDSLPTAMSGLLSIVPDGRLAPLVAGTSLDLDAPAMIFPTSGSTGEPKLVVYAARTLQVKVQASIGLMGVCPGDTVLIAGSHGNFGFVHHALVFLLAGGTLCLFDVRAQGLAALFKTIRDDGVGHVRFTPSLFRAAARLEPGGGGLHTLKGVRFSGEPLLWNDVTMARRLLDPDCQIQNVYGSTESAIFIWTDDRTITDERALAPIGQAYPSFDFAIEFDAAAEPQNGTREGRLFIRSRHQALGDWQDGRVDGSRFPADPAIDGMRLYDTGDIVRQEPDGHLTMLGRADRIVKVNGYRVSLAEIEAHLLAMPDCAQAAVIERPGAFGTSLAAFVTRQAGTVGRLDGRRWLIARLPAAMVPAQVLEIDALPLLPGGKLNYRRLSSDLDERSALAAISAFNDLAAPPSTDLARLRALWNEVLQRPANDDSPDRKFSDLGGDSLQMLELRIGFERLFGRPMNDQAFLKRPTLRRLAELSGIEGLAAPDNLTEDGALSFHCVQPATGPSRGVVLAVPGWGGSALIEPWLASGAFTDFDVWACHLSLASANVLQGERWLQLAEEIAAAVVRGTCPAPAFVFGFSLAGYMGWLVDRLLADGPLRPEGVICLDSVTMHGPKRFQSPKLRSMLTATAHSAPGRMLLIRRAPLSGLTSASTEGMCWTAADADLQTVSVRTLEHRDMESNAVLTAVNPAIRSFLENRATSLVVNGAPIAVDTYSGRLFELICDATWARQTRLDDLPTERPKSGTYFSMSAVFYVAIAHGEIHAARALIEGMLELHPKSLKLKQRLMLYPESLKLKYALFGLSDSWKFFKLRPADPCYQPRIGSFRSIEKALALRSRQGAETIGSSNGRVGQSVHRLRELRDFVLTMLLRPVRLLIAALFIKPGR